MKISHDKSKEREGAPFRVNVGASFTGGPRRRHHFPTKAQAQHFIIAVKHRGYGEAITTTHHRERAQKFVTLGECADLFEAQHDHVKGNTISQLKYLLKSLRASFGKHDITTLTHIQLDAWLRGIDGAAETRKNHARMARRFFLFCKDWLQVIPRNPMVQVKLKISSDDPGPQRAILTPLQLSEALSYSLALESPIERSRLTAYLCLGAYAGLRTEEILNAHWEDIHWSDGEIFVRQPKRVKGWRPRYVTIQPELERILRPLAPSGPVLAGKSHGKDGTFAMDTARVMPGGQRTLYLLRKALSTHMELDSWPDNCLRHSFGTYHLAEFKNAHLTAEEMGHENVAVTRAHYAIAAKRVVASEYWGNAPKKVARFRKTKTVA